MRLSPSSALRIHRNLQLRDGCMVGLSGSEVTRMQPENIGNATISKALRLASAPLGASLRNIRGDRSQLDLAEDLAAATGYSYDQRRVSDIERGVRRPQPSVAVKAWIEACGHNHTVPDARSLVSYNQALDWFFHLRHFVGPALSAAEYFSLAETIVHFVGDEARAIDEALKFLSEELEAALLRRIANKRVL
jgi:hypothetical protein